MGSVARSRSESHASGGGACAGCVMIVINTRKKLEEGILDCMMHHLDSPSVSEERLRTERCAFALKPFIDKLNLSHLDASHNDLEDLEVSRLLKLETLVVSQNALKTLNLEGSRLRTLKADGNELETISCKQVPLYLERLDISHNNFEFLPEWITDAKSLHTISADHNNLSHVPTEIFSCCNLMDLRLNHNLLVKLPDFLSQCHMKSLSLQYNRFEKLPYNFFWALPCLEMLNLSYNSLKSIPVSCDSIINLKSLLLSGNQLSDLSNLISLLKLSRIECLHLAYNGIKELPEGFFQTLHFLRTLSLCGNELESISSHISKAHSLEKLYLHSNRLISIPKFSETNNLQVLDLACNKMHQLELASIVPKDLTYLDLSANCDLKIDPTDFQHLW
ncbi:protein phosphatase PHLPP-like protein [Caerostris darwini]|uniref:Protein phosphatase PHLPP-like protein n=1 Tax=Caerostris darwini TaxID=1538125 RepID=A0AAV4MQY2_9ARAC|nr:protein phosphatase PHLPP-like protein [Caerostris darwini]